MLSTDRLILRQWQTSDLTPFAKMNADPQVMRFFPSTLNSEQSEQLFNQLHQAIEQYGIGFWAVELKKTGDFIGFIGISHNDYLPCGPCVEIGWRIASEHWRQGYATEGALASLDYGFNETGLTEIVSLTPTSNMPSMKVMQKIGMTDSHQNFQHPKVAKESTLCEHVLYKIHSSQ